MPQHDDAPAEESPHARVARAARELPPDWADHWASEEAARAALDSAAPASEPGRTKADADGPSLHAKQHAPVGSDAYEEDGGESARKLQESQDAASGGPAAQAREAEAREARSEERKSEERKSERK